MFRIGHTFFLTDRGAVLVLTKTDPSAKRAPEQHAMTMELVLRMTFVGANPGSRVAGLEKLILHMKSKGGVWFATHEQIARYVNQRS